MNRVQAAGRSVRVPWALSAVDLVLTPACNLRCAYCYQTARRSGRMPWPVAKSSIVRLLESRSRPRQVCLTGGEPLLAAPLVRRVVRFIRATEPARHRVRLDVITNGTLLDDRMAAFLAAHDVGLQISMDGVPAAQALRGAWTYARLDALLDRLGSRQPHWFRRRVSVAITLTPATVRHLAESFEYLVSKDVREISVAPALGAARGWRSGRLAELDRELGRVFSASLAHRRKTGRVPLTLFRKTVEHHAHPSQPMCGITGGSKIVVDVDGRAYGCHPAIPSFITRPSPLLEKVAAAMSLGTISDLNPEDALPAFREALDATGLFGPRGRLVSPLGACRSCQYVGRCAVCPLSIAYAPGARNPRRVPGFACAFNRTALRYRDRFPPRVPSPSAWAPFDALTRLSQAVGLAPGRRTTEGEHRHAREPDSRRGPSHLPAPRAHGRRRVP